MLNIFHLNTNFVDPVSPHHTAPHREAHLTPPQPWTFRPFTRKGIVFLPPPPPLPAFITHAGRYVTQMP